jgi:hypothetical protein
MRSHSLKGLSLSILFLFSWISEREGERNRNILDERGSWTGCVLHVPYWGWSLKP